MKIFLLVSALFIALFAVTSASPIPDEDAEVAIDNSQDDETSVDSKDLPVSDPIFNNFNLNTATNSFQNLTANLTALIQYLVQLEVNKTIAALTAEQNFTGLPKQVELKPAESTIESNKPLFFVRRRPDFYPGPPHPAYFYNPYIQEPYYAVNPYMYRGAAPEFRRPINPTQDDSLSDEEALEQLEYILSEQRSDPEARGLLSSISSSSNAAKNSFKSFFSSLSAQLPSVSVITKTLYVPGLAVNG